MPWRVSMIAIGMLNAGAAVLTLTASANVVVDQPSEEYRVDLEPEFHYHLSDGYHQEIGYRARKVHGGGWQAQEIVMTELNGATERREAWLPRSRVLIGAEAERTA